MLLVSDGCAKPRPLCRKYSPLYVSRRRLFCAEESSQRNGKFVARRYLPGGTLLGERSWHRLNALCLVLGPVESRTNGDVGALLELIARSRGNRIQTNVECIL